MSHDISRTGGPEFRATCSCGDSSPVLQHGWQVEDWVIEHRTEITRKQASIGRAGSLRYVAAYYRRMAAAEETTEQHRVLWSALAQEIEDRLAGKSLSDDDQLPLF